MGIIIMMAVLMIRPAESVSAAREAIALWGLDIVPGLFPYMVLCRQLSVILKKRSSHGFIPLLLGLLGGSPSGASILSETIAADTSRKKLYACCAFLGTISPMFLTGTVSAWMGSSLFGNRLLFAHALSALLTMLMVFIHSPEQETCSIAAASNAETEPIRDSVYAVLGVGGCIVFFSVLSGIVSPLFHGHKIADALFHGVLEISGGLKKLSACACTEMTKGILSAALCGFSGFSILSQNLLFLRPLGIRMKHLILFGVLRAFVSAVLMGILMFPYPR